MGGQKEDLNESGLWKKMAWDRGDGGGKGSKDLCVPLGFPVATWPDCRWCSCLLLRLVFIPGSWTLGVTC